MASELQILSPLETFYKWETLQPDKIYLRQPIKGEWQNYTWKGCGNEVRRMAAHIKSLNLEPNSKIAILSKNCVHWVLSDYAIWMAGHVSVPLYPNLSPVTVKQILGHSESKLLFVGKLDDWEYLKPGVPENLNCIAYPFYGVTEYENWDEIIKRNEPIKEDVARPIEELSTIMYTSGTTGKPKGVMHSFFNFSYAVSYAFPELYIDEEATFFSYLPMCHIAERLLIEAGSLYSGGKVSFAESLDAFPENLRDTSPTVFLAVPRIWSKFQEKILEKLPQKKINTFLKIPVLSSVVKRKVKKNLGLTKATNIFSGAAPISAELIVWFKKIGIEIQQAYAMTEDCCYSHVNLKQSNKIGTVGQRLPHVEIKLSEQGEILIKHKALMLGYYKEPEMTAEAFTPDGFFKTGDKGEVDGEGYLKITGRVKEMFKTSKGKYVAPSPIEIKLSGNPDIDHVLVVGYALPQPICLIVLSPSGKSKPGNEIQKSIKELISNVNRDIDPYERLEKAVILNNDWTIDNGLLTPTLKIKRTEVEKIYQPQYEKWFNEKGVVIWEDGK